MKRLAATLGLFAVLLPGAAGAACGGTDLLAKLRVDDPAAAAGIEARAAAVPNSEGLFWRIEKPGLAPSHIFGTYHAAEAVRYVPDAVWTTLDNARVAVFELTLAEQAAMAQRMATDSSFVLDASAPKFAEVMNATDLEALRKAYGARGMAIEAVERMRPWLQVSLLSLPPCQFIPMAGGERPIDKMLAERARANGIAEAGLETYEQALGAFASMDRETLLTMLISSARFADLEEDIFRTNLSIYASGRSTLIYEFSIWISEQAMPGEDVRGASDRMMTPMLDKRNNAWMPGMVAHIEGGNAFIAVGALHLQGKAGLIERLRARGFTVTRVE